VGYLDTDVGQPEFAPPGCISFHVVDDAIEGQHVFAWGLCAAVLEGIFSLVVVCWFGWSLTCFVVGFCADLLNPTLREAERCHWFFLFDFRLLSCD
jgi:hypothetical protein